MIAQLDPVTHDSDTAFVDTGLPLRLLLHRIDHSCWRHSLAHRHSPISSIRCHQCEFAREIGQRYHVLKILARPGDRGVLHCSLYCAESCTRHASAPRTGQEMDEMDNLGGHGGGSMLRHRVLLRRPLSMRSSKVFRSMSLSTRQQGVTSDKTQRRIIFRQCLPLATINGTSYVHAVLTALADIIYASLPIIFLWNAEFSKRAKYSIGGILIVGSVGCVCTLVRIGKLENMHASSRSQD